MGIWRDKYLEEKKLQRMTMKNKKKMMMDDEEKENVDNGAETVDDKLAMKTHIGKKN